MKFSASIDGRTGSGGDNGRPLRVLAIDKTAVLPSVRDRWDRLARIPGVDLTLLAPEIWIENYRRVRFETGEDRAYRPVVGKALWPGKEARSLYVRGMRKAFRSSRPDVVVMMEESFSMFALQTVLAAHSLAPGAKLIFYSNNVTSYERINYRLGKLYRRIGAWATPKFDVGLCVNDLAVEVLGRARYDVQARKLFYGIDERLFRPYPVTEARRSLGLPAAGTILLYAGRLLELKGVQDLLAAFDRLVATFPSQEFHLLIVGEGDYEETLRRVALKMDAADRIEFRAMVPIREMPLLMSAADAFVLPSRMEIHEQFGRVNIEAMLCNTTIVGSTSGGIPGAIGDNGFIFQAGDVDDLAKKLAEVVRHPAEAAVRRTRARKYALEGFSTGAFLKGLIVLFRELTGRPLEDEGLAIESNFGVEP